MGVNKQQMMDSMCALLFMTLLLVQCQAENSENCQNRISCLESIDFSVSRIVDSQILAPDDLSNDLGRSVCGRSSIPKPFKYFCKASDYFHKLIYNPTSAVVVLLSDMACVLARSILAADEKMSLSVACFHFVHKISDYSGISCCMDGILHFAKYGVSLATNLIITYDKMVGLSGCTRRAGAVLIALLRLPFQLVLEGLDQIACSDYPSGSQIPNPQGAPGAAIIALAFIFTVSIGCAGVRWLPSCISVLILYGGFFVTLVAFVPKDTAIAAISTMYGFLVLLWSSCAVLVLAKAMVGSVLMLSCGSYAATVNIWRLIFLLLTLLGRVVTGIIWVSVVYCTWCAQVAMLVARTIWNIVSKCVQIAFTAAAWVAVAIVRTAVIIDEFATTATVASWTALLWMAGMTVIIWTAAALLYTYCEIFVTLVAFVPKDTAVAAISAMYGFLVLMGSSCAVLVLAKAMVGSVLMLSCGSYAATVNIWRLIFLLLTLLGRVVTGIIWVSVVYCTWCAQVAMLVARTIWNIVSKCVQIAFTAAAWVAVAIVRTAVIIDEFATTATVASWTALLWMAGMTVIIWTAAALLYTYCEIFVTLVAFVPKDTAVAAISAMYGFLVLMGSMLLEQVMVGSVLMLLCGLYTATVNIWRLIILLLTLLGRVVTGIIWVSVVYCARCAAALAALAMVRTRAFQLSQLAAFLKRKCYGAAIQDYFKCMSCLELLATDDLGMRAADCACEKERQICRHCQAGWVKSKVGEQVFPVPCAGGYSARIGQREVKCVVDDATWQRSV